MDSNEINKFAKTWGIQDFIGVFAVDELTLIPKGRNGLLIFNTDTSQNTGQHWIALCITKNNIYYFDRYRYKKKSVLGCKTVIRATCSTSCSFRCVSFRFCLVQFASNSNK